MSDLSPRSEAKRKTSALSEYFAGTDQCLIGNYFSLSRKLLN